MDFIGARSLWAILPLLLIGFVPHSSNASGDVLCVVSPCPFDYTTWQPAEPIPATPRVKKMPVASFTLGRDSSTVPVKVVVDAAASGQVATKWSVTDGQTSSNQATTFNFSLPGTYTIGLTVTDSDGISDTLQTTFTAKQKPSAAFTAMPTSGPVPLKVALDGSASKVGSGEVVKYQWDASDGQSALGKVANLTFTKEGTFTITLTITDENGVASSSKQSITIIPNDYERVFNWAEATYPSLFMPARQMTQSLGTYSFRFYGGTNSIIGIKGGRLIYRGGAVNNCDQIECDLGDYSIWLVKAQEGGF